MTTTAKFVCDKVDAQPEYQSVTFRAVYGDGKENKEWSRWTPSGSLQMTITNPNVFGAFKVGKEYMLEIYPAV